MAEVVVEVGVKVKVAVEVEVEVEMRADQGWRVGGGIECCSSGSSSRLGGVLILEAVGFVDHHHAPAD